MAGSFGNFYFIIFQETSGIASAFYHAIVGGRIKTRVLISNVSAGNMLPANYRLGEPALSIIHV
jgi:hypothetical protein